MKSSVANVPTALAIPALASLGGASAVSSGYDDATGGLLISFVLIIGAVALSWRSTHRRG